MCRRERFADGPEVIGRDQNDAVVVTRRRCPESPRDKIGGQQMMRHRDAGDARGRLEVRRFRFDRLQQARRVLRRQERIVRTQRHAAQQHQRRHNPD